MDKLIEQMQDQDTFFTADDVVEIRKGIPGKYVSTLLRLCRKIPPSDICEFDRLEFDFARKAIIKYLIDTFFGTPHLSVLEFSDFITEIKN